MVNKDKFKINLANSDLSSRRRLSIDAFLGVDYNPAQLQVASNHATDILNFIYKDRVNQKRRGWEQLAKIPDDYTYYVRNDDGTFTQKTNTPHFNGFFHLVGEDNLIYYVAHIGKLLYQVTGIGKDKSFLDIEFKPLVDSVVVGANTYNVALELEDYKSSAFVGDKRLYILGGNKYYVLKVNNGVFDLAEVEDHEETYIPVTTIGITYKDSPVSGITALDDVNMMTQWRRNKLVSGTYIDDGVTLRTTRFWDYELDTNVQCKKPTDINNIVVKISSLREVEQNEV